MLNLPISPSLLPIHLDRYLYPTKLLVHLVTTRMLPQSPQCARLWVWTWEYNSQHRQPRCLGTHCHFSLVLLMVIVFLPLNLKHLQVHPHFLYIHTPTTSLHPSSVLAGCLLTSSEGSYICPFMSYSDVCLPHACSHAPLFSIHAPQCPACPAHLARPSPTLGLSGQALGDPAPPASLSPCPSLCASLHQPANISQTPS